MKEIKQGNRKAGLTAKAGDGVTSLPVMKHGDEPSAMLLALLNSPLETMIANNSAKVVGKCLTKSGRWATIVFFYDVEPTPVGTLKSVGTLEAK